MTTAARNVEEEVFYALLRTAPLGSVVTMDMARAAVEIVSEYAAGILMKDD
jgi:hypothetical protein